MREPVEPAGPGEPLKAALTWSPSDDVGPGATVQATDGPLGVVRERRRGEGPEHGYLGVETDEGLLFVPDRLIRETRGDVVYLSLPAADAKANASRGTLPTRRDPTDLPEGPG